ncbi:MAG: hypothetical protein E5W81_12630 [Mesorhizobium sp.]|nr:MAG: hypothetical protein E5W81_12630 [Mesorhizobium sp.]
MNTAAPIETKTVRSPVSLSLPGGNVLFIERTVTTVSDWRETPFGPVDFGYTILSPARWKVGKRA